MLALADGDDVGVVKRAVARGAWLAVRVVREADALGVCGCVRASERSRAVERLTRVGVDFAVELEQLVHVLLHVLDVVDE